MADIDAKKLKTLSEKFAMLIDVASKIVSIFAIIIGGWWAMRQFTVQRQNAQTLLVSVTPQLAATDTESPVIIADVSLKNIGKVPIWAGEHTGKYHGKGCELTVIEYGDRSKGRSAQQQIVDWDRGGGKRKYVVEKYNLLERYGAFGTQSYMLNPGVEYHETGVVPVAKGKLYGVRVRFFTDANWTAADIAYVYVPSGKKE